MENASKALIIAGAILLSILLISLGIMIFKQAQGVVTDTGMSEAELSTFNQKFTKYQGKKRGTDVKSLLQEIIVNNNQDENSDRQVSVTIKDSVITGTGVPSAAATTDTDLSAIINNVKSNTYYKVTPGYSSGRVSSMEISKP